MFIFLKEKKGKKKLPYLAEAAIISIVITLDLITIYTSERLSLLVMISMSSMCTEQIIQQSRGWSSSSSPYSTSALVTRHPGLCYQSSSI